MRDLSQPFRGIGNILRGAANIVGAPLLFIANTVRYAMMATQIGDAEVMPAIGGSIRYRDLDPPRSAVIIAGLKFFGFNMITNVERTTSWLLDAVSSTIRGVTQLVTTPLAWFGKMPLRGIITAITGKPNIESNSGIRKLVTEAKNNLGVKNGERIDKSTGDPVLLDGIRHELHRKYEKAKNRGQQTNVPQDKEKDLFTAQYFKYGRSYECPLREDRAASVLQYLGLFSTNIKEQQQSINSPAIDSNGWTCLNAYKEDKVRKKQEAFTDTVTDAGESTPLMRYKSGC